jgi:hypothetical protein
VSRKIKVNVCPTADQYSSTDERIIEYSSPYGGGLIAFRLDPIGHLVLDLYREDDTVQILVNQRHKEQESE